MANKKDAIEQHKAARRELERVSRKTPRGHITDEFVKANSKVIAAEKNISWWRR
jgi:hypothetical protein